MSVPGWVWVAMFGYQETLRKSGKFVWIYYFIRVDILFYCDVYIILLC